MDYGDAHATLACSSTIVGDWTGIPGTFQVISGSDGRALSYSCATRYVERNALRAKLVERAEEWQWSSLWRLAQNNPILSEFLSEWPMERPQRWIEFVNEPDKEEELDYLRCSAQRG